MRTKLMPIIGVLAFMLATGGCAITPKKAAHRTLETVGLSVQKGMQSAAAGVKAGKITPEEWKKVTALHDTKFLPAYRTACDVASFNFDALAPADLLAIQVQLLTLINQVLQ